MMIVPVPVYLPKPSVSMKAQPSRVTSSVNFLFPVMLANSTELSMTNLPPAWKMVGVSVEVEF